MRMIRVVMLYYHIGDKGHLVGMHDWPVSCSSQEGTSLSKEEGTGRTFSITWVPSAWPLPPEPIAFSPSSALLY